MTTATGGTAQVQDAPVRVHKILGLIVHGVGEQSAGSTLRSVVKDFYPLIRARIDPKAGIDVRPLDDAAPPEVRISFRNAKPDERWELVVREVHWAKAFAPPSFGGLIAGVLELLTNWFARVEGIGSSTFVSQVEGLPESMQRRVLRRLLCVNWFIVQLVFRAVKNAAIVAVMLVFSGPAFLIATVLLVGGWMGWARMPANWLRWLAGAYARFQPSVVELAIVVAIPFVLVLYLALLLLESIGPLRGILPDWVGKLRSSISAIGTTYLGDVWVYTCQPWEASQIRTRFEERFKRLVEEEAAGAEAMFVVAHSLGCPVSYEGLSGRRMREFIGKHFVAPNEKTAEDHAKIDRLFYFTVGSALPAIWASVPEREQERLYRPLPASVHWEDFYSEYDPVRMGLICDPVPPPYDPVEPDPAKRDKTVVNQMDMFSEHNAYWNNAEQVLAPMLDTITAGRFADRLRLNRTARNHRVRILSAWKALAWLTAPAVVAIMAVAGGGEFVSGWANLGFLEDDPWKDWLLMPITWAAVAAVCAVVLYSTVVKWCWDAWDHSVKYQA